jgi:hypothetical protein
MAKTLGSGKTITFQKSLYDGEASIFKEKRRGNNYQFRMWIKEEKKHYQKSLRTDDYDIALEKAKKLTKDLMAHGMSDKRVFSISVEELIEQYLDYRKNDIDKETGITRKRWMTLSSQLKHFSLICGAKTKLSNLNVDDLFEYSVLRKNIKPCEASTIRTEKSTINHCIKFGYRNKLIHFEKFNFKQIIIKAEAVGKRDTFTDKEYDKLTRYMFQTWTKIWDCEPTYGQRDFGRGGNNTHLIKSAEEEQLERLMVRDYVLALANSCLRIGEAEKLTWGDLLSYESHIVESEYERDVKEIIIVEIRVRWETSKVRKNRTFFCRGGQYFDRLKKRQHHTNDEDLVFSMNGKDNIDHRMRRKHWDTLMKGIGITNYYERKLSWASLRHYGITQRVVSGVDLIDISKMAGTSVKHIENTYLKYRKEQSRTAALKSYKKQEGQIKFL